MLTALVVLLRLIGLMCRGHRAVALENLALRQQLAALRRIRKRPQLRPTDRLFWIVLASAWREWRTAVMVVQPETVLRWHRQWLRRRWADRSKRIRHGRPRTDAPIRTLVDEMAAANPLWGAPRIHGELSKLGIEVSERTVSRMLQRRRPPPSQTWRTFLANHAADLVSMDFFTVPTFTGRVLFVLVLLAHHRRRVVHLAITDHPTAAWTAQQVIEAFPDETAPRWLVRDRDAIYSDVFRRRVAGMGITEVVGPVPPLAESVRGATDRIPAPRMSGSRHHTEPDAFAPPACALCLLLPWDANPPVPREGRAHATTRPGIDGRSRGGGRRSWWTSPSVRATRRLTRCVTSRMAATRF